MPSQSKENQILELILGNSPLKHWHFEEFVKKTSMSRASVNKWLKRYQEKNLIKKIKEKNKFPYFIVGWDNPVYKAMKKQFMLNKLYESGLITNLISNKNIKIAIVFGSISRGDWYKDSDIDLFIYGNVKKIEKIKYELKIKRDIELHIFNDKKDIKEVKTGLIKNIINGYVVKGDIREIAEVSL